MTRLVDHDARERIRASLDESMVVEAGTGKTSELVARLVAVLGLGVKGARALENLARLRSWP